MKLDFHRFVRLCTVSGSNMLVYQLLNVLMASKAVDWFCHHIRGDEKNPVIPDLFRLSDIIRDNFREGIYTAMYTPD